MTGDETTIVIQSSVYVQFARSTFYHTLIYPLFLNCDARILFVGEALPRNSIFISITHFTPSFPLIPRCCCFETSFVQ